MGRAARTDVPALRGGAPVRGEPLPPWPPPLEAAEAEEIARLLGGGAAVTRQLPRKRAFEAAFAAWCGVRFAVAVNSGTTALDLALEALRLPPDAVVLAADYGHPATVRRAAERHRLRLLDVAAGSWCLDPAAVERALAADGAGRIGAVVTTHLAGQPAGAAALAGLCAAAGVPLIEDAAHAHGAEGADGRRAGAFGRLGCFSLHDTKTLPAGEGGVVVTDDPVLAERIGRRHDLGRDPGGGPYDFRELGGNFRLSEPAAALAALRLRRLDADNARRQAAADALRRLLPADACLELLPPAPDVARHVHHFVAARYRPERCRGLGRGRFVLALSAEGIACSAGWPRPLRALPAVAARLDDAPANPVTDAAVAAAVWLDQRLLLDPRGPAQIVEAVARVQALADSLTGGRR